MKSLASAIWRVVLSCHIAGDPKPEIISQRTLAKPEPLTRKSLHTVSMQQLMFCDAAVRVCVCVCVAPVAKDLLVVTIGSECQRCDGKS